MRPLLVVFLLALFAPAASAASQVHVTYLGDDYAVTYVSHATGELETMRVPSTARGYDVEGSSFALPVPPAPTETTRVVFVADIGTDRNASRVVDAIRSARPSLVLIGGDLAYAHGDDEVWEEFFELLEPLAATVPVMPAYGNHEGYCEEEDGGYSTCAKERERYETLFELPNDEELYYAFDWGPMRITVLDTEAYLDDDEHPTQPAEQGTFLNASLANDSSPWDVVMYHRALRTTNLHEGSQVGDQREHLEDVLDGGADLVLQGHVHAYERLDTTANGTVFVTSGGGGRPTYEEWEPMPAWLATRSAEHHFVVLDVSPTRIEGRTLRPDGSTLDTFSLTKPAPPSPTPPSASPTPSTRAGTPTPTHAGYADDNNSTGRIEEAGTPLGWVLLVVALMVSARLSRPRVRG